MKTQTWEWALAQEKNIPGGGVGYALALDNKSNVYVAATPIMHSYCGQQFTCTSGGGLVAKHTPQGKLLWLINVPDCFHISSDVNGDLYVAGIFHKTVDFCGNGNPDTSLSQSSASGSAAYIARYSSAGALIWTRKWDNWPSARIKCIKTDMSGNSYVAIHHANSVGQGAYTLVKYDGNGNVLWETEMIANSRPSALDADENGNCYVTGNFSGSAKFGDISLSADGEIFICKYDKQGRALWARTAGKKRDESRALCLDNQGGFFLGGQYLDPAPQFGNITISQPGYGAFLARYDTAGNCLWANGYHDGLAGAIASDQAGNCYLSGFFFNNLTFGTGPNPVTLNTLKFGDLFVAKFDIRGSLKWALNTSGPIGQGNGAASVVYDGMGGCYITGVFTSTTIFGDSTLSIPLSSDYAMYLAKIKDLSFNPVSVKEEMLMQQQFHVFPNPGQRLFKISYTTEEDAPDAVLFLRNISGQLLWQETFPIHHRQLEEQIDLGNLPKGLYLLELVAGKHHQVRKLVLN